MTDRPTLLDIFTPIFLEVLDVLDGAGRGAKDLPEAGAFITRIQDALDAAVASAEAQGKPHQNAALSKRAVIAWIDDVLSPYKDWYGQVPNIQSRVYDGATVLGKAFYQDLNALSKESQKEVIELFFTCLALGFKGDKIFAGAQADQEIARLKEDLGYHLTCPLVDLDKLPEQKIFPQPYAMPDPPEAPPGPPLPKSWGKWIAAAAACVLLLLAGVGAWLFGRETDPRPDILAQARAIVSTYDCARLSVDVSEDLTLSYTGFLRSEANRAALDAELLAIEHVTSVVSDVDVYPSPLCDVLLVLERSRLNGTADARTPVLSVNRPSGRYRDQELLVADVTVAADQPGYLHVSYIGQAGTITHLFPNNDMTSGAVGGGVRLKLGYDDSSAVGAGVAYDVETNLMYRIIADPPGKSLLFAIWSREPIFQEKRPELEGDVDAYLRALAAAVDRGAAGGEEAVQYTRTLSLTVER
jgi:hypothetical protein